MVRTHTQFSLLPILVGAMAFFWTITGQTSNPPLTTQELPRDIVRECGSACADDTGYRSYWMGRTPKGDLFMVVRLNCETDRCPYWFVEKAAAQNRMLLRLTGTFTLHRFAGRYPVVEARTRSNDEGIMRSRFEWDGERYTRTQAERVYEVNGVECGTRDECFNAAERAMKQQRVGHALRIWQQVHGVAWF